MSYRGRAARTGAALLAVPALVAAALAGRLALRACGPFYPEWLLAGDLRTLEAPRASFSDEIDRLLPEAGRDVQAVTDDHDPYRQTVTRDLADFEAALARLDLPAERRAALAASYRQTREGIGRLAKLSYPRFPSGISVPPEIPGEFQDYLQGALAYQEEREADADAAWRRLLDRPAAERPFRTTWAAYMLGRLHVEDHPDEARSWLRRTRELAGQGFADPLGLAAASLGWEARIELKAGRFREALHLYARQHRSGDATAVVSLRMAAARALQSTPEEQLALARDRECQRILTAYVLSQVNPEERPTVDRSRAWLRTLGDAEVRDLPQADRLAWLAYATGDFKAADSWLRVAPARSPMARWLRAKLLMRAGRLAEAEAILARLGSSLPDDPVDPFWPDDGSFDGHSVPPVSAARVAGERGVVQLSRGRYAPALDSFLRGSYWLDAAYVAERVMTVPELRSYVERRWPRGKPVREAEEEDAANLRALLGRRLAREGRYAEAEPYLPEEERPALRELAAALRSGRGGRSRAARADSLFQAACLVRHQGIELLGTELEPDWQLFSGELDPDFIPEQRGERRPPLAATADERARARRSRAEPQRRFHYRYQGADLAWRAAALLPDGSEEKARILAVAGSWLKDRDPKAADRFYKALVRTCGRTELGRLADELRWFPEVEDCVSEEAP